MALKNIGDHPDLQAMSSVVGQALSDFSRTLQSALKPLLDLEIALKRVADSMKASQSILSQAVTALAPATIPIRLNPFFSLLAQVEEHPEAVDKLVHQYFPPWRVFDRVTWARLRGRLGVPTDPMTQEQLSPEDEYYRLAQSAVVMALLVSDLAEIGMRYKLEGPFVDTSIDEVCDRLCRVIRHYVRRDVYGPIGEGEYTQRRWVILDADFTGAESRIPVYSNHRDQYSPGEVIDDDRGLQRHIDMDSLTPAERTAVERIRDGFREGYKFDGKRKDSMREFLGRDYRRVTRAFERARKKLKGEP